MFRMVEEIGVALGRLQTGQDPIAPHLRRGNGRMGRLWQTLILSRWNPIFAAVSVETLIGQHQAEYYAALNAGNREATCTPFIEFMLAMIRDTLRDMLATEQQTEQARRLLAAMDTAPLSAREISWRRWG